MIKLQTVSKIGLWLLFFICLYFISSFLYNSDTPKNEQPFIILISTISVLSGGVLGIVFLLFLLVDYNYVTNFKYRYKKDKYYDYVIEVRRLLGWYEIDRCVPTKERALQEIKKHQEKTIKKRKDFFFYRVDYNIVETKSKFREKFKNITGVS